MKWQDIEAAYPDGTGIGINRALTHLARTALGMPTRAIAPESMLADIRQLAGDRYIAWHLGKEEIWRGAAALIGTWFGDWDLVARVTGGAMLGTRVVVKKTFEGDTRAFARHFATAVRAKLPAGQVMVAMTEQRTRFATNTCVPDERIAVLAAHLFVRELCAVRDPVDATRRWLDGETIASEAAPASHAVADGEDPRVKIFERYAAELDVDGPPVDGAEDWRRDLHSTNQPYDDLAVRSFVAQRPMFERWQTIADPMIATWLGVPLDSAMLQRWHDVGVYGGISSAGNWDGPVRRLSASGTGPPAKKPFKPGQFFKDDGKKLIAYLANAVASHASEAHVEPAWIDFLSRRSPATTSEIERGPLRWAHLLMLQAAVTHHVGKRPRGEVGLALRKLITGL